MLSDLQHVNPLTMMLGMQLAQGMQGQQMAQSNPYAAQFQQFGAGLGGALGQMQNALQQNAQNAQRGEDRQLQYEVAQMNPEAMYRATMDQQPHQNYRAELGTLSPLAGLLANYNTNANQSYQTGLGGMLNSVMPQAMSQQGQTQRLGMALPWQSYSQVASQALPAAINQQGQAHQLGMALPSQNYQAELQADSPVRTAGVNQQWAMNQQHLGNMGQLYNTNLGNQAALTGQRMRLDTFNQHMPSLLNLFQRNV